MQAISSSAERVGWSGLGPAVALLICISNLGGVGAYLAALSRIPFVAGIDRFLPPAFGRVHPKWGTPYISLIVQALCCVLFILLGQFGSTVHGAYQVLVSMTIITNFVPYLFMFAAMIRLQREPVEPGVVRVPGGKPVAIALAAVGFVTTVRGHHGLDDSRRQRAEQGPGGREDSAAQRGAVGRRNAAVLVGKTKVPGNSGLLRLGHARLSQSRLPIVRIDVSLAAPTSTSIIRTLGGRVACEGSK